MSNGPDTPRKIDPKDVAAGNALGTAQRYGSGVFRRRRAEAAGGATGTAQSRARAPSTGSRLLTALIFLAVLIAMLVLMVRAG
ncbi:MAG: hypothetical protein ACOYLQ_10360 [Hyphomicrobiaceae bacterium]